MNNILQEIIERINNEQPNFGSINILLTFHDKKLVGVEFTKTEKTVIKKEK
jgi:hypothetical protein